MKNIYILLIVIILFSCSKKNEVTEPPKEDLKKTQGIMRLPNESEVSVGYILLDPVDGHYKNNWLDFGTSLTHPSSGYSTGQSGVGIHSIGPNQSGLLAVEFEGDRFTAYLPSFLSLPSYGPLSTTEKVTSIIGYEIDTSGTIQNIGYQNWLNIQSITIYVDTTSIRRYFSLDTIKAKAKGIKIKNPSNSMTINGQLLFPNSDGIVIYKGRILMNTNSPTGMAVYPYDYVAVNETAQPKHPLWSPYPEFLPTYYTVDDSTSLLFTVKFDPTRTYGTIVSYDYDGPNGYLNLNSNFVGNIEYFSGSATNGSYYLTFHATLPDGRIVSCDKEYVFW